MADGFPLRVNPRRGLFYLAGSVPCRAWDCPHLNINGMATDPHPFRLVIFIHWPYIWSVISQWYLPLNFLYWWNKLMVAEPGFAPGTFGLWARRATRLLHSAIWINKSSSISICTFSETAATFSDMRIFSLITKWSSGISTWFKLCNNSSSFFI